jgi:DNA-binding CsgD family transcriptional regulator
MVRSVEPARPGPARAVIGRAGELETVDAFLETVPDEFHALLISGPAGIGKSTILDRAVEAAGTRGYRVVWARPTEVETGLAFAGLNDLLGEIVGAEAMAGLPEPQRIALEAALLRVTAATPPQPLAVAVAVRHIVAETAARQPVVLAIDDIQWLDDPTARVLEFVLRRLDAAPVGLVAGLRSPTGVDPVAAVGGVAEARISRVHLGGLSVDEVDRLLRARAGLELVRPTLVRLRAVSAGNPFYALELGRAIASGESTGDPAVLAVPPSLEGLVGRRLDDLGEDAAVVTLFAAAAAHPTVALLAAAAGQGVADRGVAEAGERSVLVVDGRDVRFSHPLLAAAAYARVSPDRRRAIHARLAEVVMESEERARHLARATTAPDEAVAAALEDAAAIVSSRGAPDAAAELAERAAELTPERDRAATRRRIRLAAELRLVAGDTDRTRALLWQLVDASVGPQERAEALAELAHLLLVLGEWDESRALYREAESIVDEDPRRRIAIELGLAGLAFVTWHDWRDESVHAVEALRLAERLADPTLLFQALGHAASWRAVLEEDWRELMEWADRLASSAAVVPAVEHPDLQFSRLLMEVGELDESRRRVDRLIDDARQRGDWHGLPRLLLSLATLQLWGGQTAAAKETIESASTGVFQTGEGAWMFVLQDVTQAVAARLGEVDAARAVERDVSERSAQGRTLLRQDWAVALTAAELELALGDAPRALTLIEPLLERSDDDPLWPAAACELVVLGVEILVAVGRPDQAAELLDRWGSRLQNAGPRWITASAERASALVMASRGDPEGALAAADRSIELADGCGMPYVLARALLTAGDVRRRARQRGRARDAYGRAAEIFERLGARLWTERTRSELSRVAQKRAAGAPLTGTERQLVALVAEGRTNREIADTLFMSVHTVEAHLTRLYRALDVQSRTELARLVADGTDPRLQEVAGP